MAKRSKTGEEVKLFEDLYHYVAGPADFLGQVLAGHLAIEFLLRKLICQYDSNLERLADGLPHARLIELSHQVGILSAERTETLVLINSLRNRFAHQILYNLELDEIFKLFASGSRGFTDYSDGIKEGLGEISKVRSAFELRKYFLSELFLAIVYDLHREYVRRGGDEETP